MSSNKPHKALFEKGRKTEVAIDHDGNAGLLMKRGTAENEVTPTVAGTDACVGYTESQADAGDFVLFQKFGIVTLYADGAITQDAELSPSGNHDGHATVGAASDTIVGAALEDASDGDSFKAILYLDKTKTV